MKIQKISVRNFYSYKKLDLDFSHYSGIVRVLGRNKDSGSSNGAGKSAIFEAVTWGVFGQTIRKSTEEALVNSQEGKDCSVSVLIEKEGLGEVEILRSKRPTSLTVKVNGVVRNKDHASETQSFLEDLLDTDYKSFLASVVFGQHSDFTFLDSSPEDKRKIIKNCFNLDDLYSKRTAVKQLKSSFTAEFKVLKTLIDNLKKEEDDLLAKVPGNKYQIIELPSLESILENEKDIESMDRETREHQRQLRKERDKHRRLVDAIGLGVYEEDKVCHACNNSYRKHQGQDDIDVMTTDANALKVKITSIETSMEELKTKKEKIIPEFSSSQWAKYNEKNKLIQNSQESTDRLATVTEQLKDYEEQTTKLQALIEVMKFWETAFSEKGLIRYIVRNILDYFNIKSNEYASILTNNQFSIEFNDELSETIKNNGVVTKYISLSGGEKRKVNLAIMLSLQELSSKISRTNCNLLFFDEVCDNIDDSGILAVNTLLKTLNSQYPEKVIMVITHNNYLQDLLGESQSITINKKKGISSI
jgi:DNA repair exonuclease SbcCD ATPase subunit